MRRTNRAYNAFADSRDNRFFGRATDESIKMRAHRNSRFDLYADAILRDAVDRRATHVWAGRVDNLWINTRPDRFQHCLASAFRGKVDGASAIEIERNACLISGNQGKNHVAHVAACKIMRFKRIAADVESGFHRRNSIINNQTDRHFP